MPILSQRGCGPNAVCMGAKGNQGCNQEGLVNPSCVTSGCNQQNTINSSCIGKCSCFNSVDRKCTPCCVKQISYSFMLFPLHSYLGSKCDQRGAQNPSCTGTNCCWEWVVNVHVSNLSLLCTCFNLCSRVLPYFSVNKQRMVVACGAGIAVPMRRDVLV